MRIDPQAGIVPDGSERKKLMRRKPGRLQQDTLTCNLGTVLDLSVGGMRVQCAKLPPERIRIKIDRHPLPGPLNAVVTWSRRVGMFKHEVGFRFEDVSPEVAEVLTRIAGVNRFRRVL